MNIKFLPLALNIGGGFANILISVLFWYLFNRKPHKWYRKMYVRKTEMPILQWFAMTITIPYIREGGRTVGLGRDRHEAKRNGGALR